MNDALEQMLRAYWGAAPHQNRLPVGLRWDDAVSGLQDQVRTSMRAAIAAIPEDDDALVWAMCDVDVQSAECEQCVAECGNRDAAIRQIAALKAALVRESGDG